MDIEEMLDEAIVKGFNDLGEIEAGTDEQSKAVENLAKLYKLRIEEESKVRDYQAKMDQNESEDCYRREQLKDEKKKSLIQFILDAIKVIVPLGAYGIWFAKGLKFEETGSFSSTTFRNFFGKIRPTK